MKQKITIAILILVIIVSLSICGYIVVRESRFAAPTAQPTTSVPVHMTEEQKISTLLHLGQTSTAPRLSSQEKITILQSFHKK
jgi:flagellar basal body-associated protein FliL